MASLCRKTCCLDPAPSSVTKGNQERGNIDPVLSVLSEIVPRSLQKGDFPAILEESIVRPKLKNTKLFTNYRTVASIPFLFKIMDKSASVSYLSQHGLFPVSNQHIDNMTPQRLRCSG